MELQKGTGWPQIYQQRPPSPRAWNLLHLNLIQEILKEFYKNYKQTMSENSYFFPNVEKWDSLEMGLSELDHFEFKIRQKKDLKGNFSSSNIYFGRS